MKKNLLILIVVVGAILVATLFILSDRVAKKDPSFAVPKLMLDISDEALPKGTAISDIMVEPLNVYDLPEDMPALPEDEITIAAMELGPSGLIFNEPVKFQMIIPSERDIPYTVFYISSSGAEVVQDVVAEFNADEKITTLTGKIFHFSLLAATKNKSDETVEEFVTRARADIADSKAKAEGITYYSEKAKHYKDLIDKAIDYHNEGRDRFPDETGEDGHLPNIGKDSYGESTALQEYSKNILADIDAKLANETDPSKKYDLLNERTNAAIDIHNKWGSGAFDEKMGPELGEDGLGESTALLERGEEIINDFLDLIENESDVSVKSNLEDRLADIIQDMMKKWGSGAFDERKMPDFRKWEKLLEELGIEITPTPTVDATPPKYVLCLFDEYIECRDSKFDLQGCIDECPYVSVSCSEVGMVGDECLITNEACSNACLDRGEAVAKECAREARCTMDEIDAKLREMYPEPSM